MCEYEFEPIHRPGTSHNNADALSRLRTVEYQECNYFNWWGNTDDNVCIKCETPDVGKNDDILICDYCMKNIHQKCHKPRVTAVPEGPWYCHECTIAAS